MYEGLRWADVVVCLITRDYVKSQWCFGEIITAKTLGSKILPLAVERDVHHPLLNDLQYVTYHGAQLQARERICGILREIDVAGGAGWPDDQSPFPGLRAFDVDMHRAFFGRRRELDDLVRLLRSLIERGEPSTPSQIRKRLDGENGLIDTVESLLYVGEPPLRRRLLIVIDQFEEMLTRSSVTTRSRFAAMLQPAVAGPVQLVVTLRSEYLDSLLADSDLAQLPIQSVTLRPLDTAVLPLVIDGPARLAGLGVDPELVSRMVADTGSGDALPLLAFTLEQLALGLPRGATLSSERYDRLGGVQGALIHQADLALADALRANARANNERNRTNVLDSLLRLVTVDERGQPTRLDVDYHQLHPQVQTELDAFIAHRLLTTRERDGTALLGVAHEAFLTAWPPLAQAITAAGAALRTRRILEQAAAEWEQADRSTSFLWGQGRVEAAISEIGAQLRWIHRNRPQVGDITDRLRTLLGYREVTSGRIEIGPTVQAFIQASIRHQQRRRSIFFAAVATALVIAFAITAIAIIQRQTAESEKISATVSGLVAQGEIRRSSNPRLALKLGLAAHRIQSTVETDTSLYSTLTSTRLIATLRTGHTRLRLHERRIPLGYIGGVAFSPDGRTLATTTSDEPTVGLWDTSDRTHSTRIATLTNGAGWVNSVAFSPDGHTLATTNDNTVALWDVTDRTHPTRTAILTGHTSPVRVVAFSPDGHALATTSGDGTSGLWDTTDRDHPTRIATLTGHTKWIYGVAFSPDGHTLATTDDNTVALWDITDRIHPTNTATLTGHTGTVNGVAFSPNGHTLATASSDKIVRLW
ncbi:MAG: TIR domain-containing protein, partial [Actinobacteria bacterium]|nr:TIR domain-containing protein [Actinomycetota bacterium]